MIRTLVSAASAPEPFDYDAAATTYRREHGALVSESASVLATVAQGPASVMDQTVSAVSRAVTALAQDKS